MNAELTMKAEFVGILTDNENVLRDLGKMYLLSFHFDCVQWISSQLCLHLITFMFIFIGILN